MSREEMRETPAEKRGRSIKARDDVQAMQFRALCERRGLPVPTSEHLFARPRRWRFDYAWPTQKVALEVEGGVYSRGRHVRPTGFLGDLEKYNHATVLGWKLIRVTPDQLFTTDTLEMLRAILTPL